MSTKPLAQARSTPGYLLRRCHQISVGIFLNHCGDIGITQLQYIALSALEELGPLDQITLGGHCAMDRNTIALVVRKLEQHGLVGRERNPNDRRSMMVTITDAGLALRQEAERAVQAAQEDILAPLNSAERKHLCALLEKIADENNALSRVPLDNRS